MRSRGWDDEEQDDCIDQLDVGANLKIVGQTGPFDLNRKEALALMVCAGLISRLDPRTAAKALRILNRWTSRDTLRNHEFLMQTCYIFGHYGKTIQETLKMLQKLSKFNTIRRKHSCTK